jgi:nucleoside permease NupC
MTETEMMVSMEREFRLPVVTVTTAAFMNSVAWFIVSLVMIAWPTAVAFSTLLVTTFSVVAFISLLGSLIVGQALGPPFEEEKPMEKQKKMRMMRRLAYDWALAAGLIAGGGLLVLIMAIMMPFVGLDFMWSTVTAGILGVIMLLILMWNRYFVYHVYRPHRGVY